MDLTRDESGERPRDGAERGVVGNKPLGSISKAQECHLGE